MATALEWPDGILPSTFDWSLSSNGTSFTSPWNGQTQAARFPGSAWNAAMTLNNLDDLESRHLEVMIVELDGLAGKIKLWDFGRDVATVYGTPKVTVGGQTGTNLATSGWTANKTVLKKGDYFTVNDELKIVLRDVVSSATGTATIPFGPQLRNSPAPGAPLEVARPYAIFRLAKKKNGVGRQPGIVNNFSFEFVEAF